MSVAAHDGLEVLELFGGYSLTTLTSLRATGGRRLMPGTDQLWNYAISNLPTFWPKSRPKTRLTERLWPNSGRFAGPAISEYWSFQRVP